MTDAAPRFMGIAWTVTHVHLVAMGILLLPMEIGLGLRLFLEQNAWAAGLLLTTGNRPDGWVLFVHLLALAFTLLLRWLWQHNHPLLRKGFLFAGLANLAILPFGLLPAAMFLWLSRRPDLDRLVPTMDVLTGKKRRSVVMLWSVALIIMAVACVPVFFLFEAVTLAWLPATVLVGLVPALALWAMLQTPKSHDEEVLHVMPPLPELSRL